MFSIIKVNKKCRICNKKLRKVAINAKISLRIGDLLSFYAPSSQQKPIRLLADAEIVSTDSQKSNNHSVGCGRDDCIRRAWHGRLLKAAFSAYNSDSGKTQEIGFEDLQVGDYVVIGLYENEKAQAQTETVHAESVERMRQKSAQD